MNYRWMLWIGMAAGQGSCSDQPAGVAQEAADAASDLGAHEAKPVPVPAGPNLRAVIHSVSGGGWVLPGACVDVNVVDHSWDPETEPIRLPCERTREPCDGVDNDADGILDPHCPTISCTAEADCTFDGLVPDADCDDHQEGGPKCKPIDGNGVEGLDQCRGTLCPPGLKCYAGDCVVAGTAAPGSACTTGLECPINSGCIPDEPGKLDTTKCVHFCHDTPCPTGFACVTPPPGIEPVSHLVCHGMTSCPQAKIACEALEAQCLASEVCPLIVVCRRLGELLGIEEATCQSLPGASADQLQLATDMASCDAQACEAR